MTICQKTLQAALALNDSWLTMSSLVLKGLGFILCFCNADLNPSTLRGCFCIRMQRNSMTAPLKLKKYLSLGRKGPRGPYSLPVKVDRPSVLQWQGIWVSTKYQNWSNPWNTTRAMSEQHCLVVPWRVPVARRMWDFISAWDGDIQARGHVLILGAYTWSCRITHPLLHTATSSLCPEAVPKGNIKKYFSSIIWIKPSHFQR